MLLPHGYEGQGPEHSSARLERYLQLCAEENMIVANFSSPANLFHALRRQIKHKVRKPLIIMSPKSLLRHKHCVSYGHEMLAGSRFQPIIDDSVVNKTAIKRLVICSGKVYYDLLEAMPAEQQDIAIIRLEQFYPYHGNIMQQTLAQYSNATEVIWCQEEPQNMGAWNFIRDHLATSTDLTIRYVGRPAKASPAEGYASWHKSTQQKLVSEALTL
jgi:2-oxoglutarate dehydrogenase E1 component